jgi:hypothetical protein
LEPWFEAEPIPPRQGKARNTEGNTMVDLAFGHIGQRGKTGSGIEYGPARPNSWVCFVEAKCLSDCSTTVRYDPLRNQLARVIENLLVFQHREGTFPARLIFTLLTPGLFKDNPTARLYGYKFNDYKNDVSKLRADIESCKIPTRIGPLYGFPKELKPRLDALTFHWATYEELLEPQFGAGLDIVSAPEKVVGLKERILAALPQVSIAADS